MAEEFNNQNPQSAEVQNAVVEALKEQKKKKRKKRLIIFAIIAVVILGIIALASNSGDEKTIESSDNTSSASAEKEETSQEETEKEQKAYAGDTVNLERIKVKYKSCNPDYKKYNQYSAPDSSNKVIRAEFEFENTSDSDVSLSGFDCYADNKKCEEFYGADDYESPTPESVSPGRTFTAVVYFEVPKDSKNIELEMEDELWGNSKTIFVIK